MIWVNGWVGRVEAGAVEGMTTAACAPPDHASPRPLPAGVVVSLARKYRVQLPVLTAVAQVLEGHISAREAVEEIMNLPQIEER